MARNMRRYIEAADSQVNHVGEAFEAFKLCIIRHKADEWQEISREDMLGTLEALKELTLAPAASGSSF